MDERKDFLGRGWAMPVDVDPCTGLVATSDYEDDIRQSIRIILETAPGERVMRPNFGCGIHDLVFEASTARRCSAFAPRSKTALRRYEARIEVLAVTVDEDATSEGKLLVELEYRVRQHQPDRQSRLSVLLPRRRAAVKPPRPAGTAARIADFERELRTRARTWIPSWSLADGEPRFRPRCCEIAARFSSEVAERLDRVGDKMALGFLDWLG